MKVTWLGYSGLLLKGDKINVLVDPHFDCEDDKIFSTQLDIILLTHSHSENLDLDCLARFIGRQEKRVTILASKHAYLAVSERFPEQNCVRMSPHSVWSVNDVTFYAVSTAHSESSAVGFIIDDGDRTFYITGDTLYNFDVIDDCLDLVSSGVDVVFLPISGEENNMNPADAADFAYEIDAKLAVPVRHGQSVISDFDFDDVAVLTPFEETEI